MAPCATVCVCVCFIVLSRQQLTKKYLPSGQRVHRTSANCPVISANSSQGSGRLLSANGCTTNPRTTATAKQTDGRQLCTSFLLVAPACARKRHRSFQTDRQTDTGPQGQQHSGHSDVGSLRYGRLVEEGLRRLQPRSSVQRMTVTGKLGPGLGYFIVLDYDVNDTVMLVGTGQQTRP